MCTQVSSFSDNHKKYPKETITGIHDMTQNKTINHCKHKT